MSQKEIFLESEADAWFERNHAHISAKNYGNDDVVCSAIIELAGLPDLRSQVPLRILEIGCGEGKRLAWLAEHLGAEVYGVEPSAKAVDLASSCGVTAHRGTADQLPFDCGQFDVVVFGFCLYLCDRRDLFKIAYEADRVMKDSAWLIIHDFFAKLPMQREYHHRAGVNTYKMDYRELFSWHPAYSCYSHRISHHGCHTFTDDPAEWVALSILRRQGR